MSEPRSLLDQDIDEFKAELLAAGRIDAMPESSRRRIWAALGAGAALAAGGSGASANTAGAVAARGRLLPLLRKLGMGAAVSGVVAWTASQWLGTHQPSAAPARLPPPGPVSASSAPPPAPDAAASAPQPAAAGTQRQQPAAASTQRRKTDRLAEEIALLDRARRALSDQDLEAGLRALADYRRAFPRGRLDTEAALLRIEALSAQGAHAQAERLGLHFLARHPQSPFATRVRSLIDAAGARSPSGGNARDR